MANSIPSNSLFRFLGEFPTRLRATLHTVHGVPRWTYHAFLLRIIRRTCSCVLRIDKSYCGPFMISKVGPQRKPAVFIRFVSSPHPENNPRKLLPSQVSSHAGTVGFGEFEVGRGRTESSNGVTFRIFAMARWPDGSALPSSRDRDPRDRDPEAWR
jgi:hypothetical protein